MSTRRKGAAEPAYPVEELLAASEAVAGVKRPVAEGALSGYADRTITKKRMLERIHHFMKRKVQK